MRKKIIYKKKYISLSVVNDIKSYYEKINDSLLDSAGPYPNPKSKLGWASCWDRQLHYELPRSPIHKIVNQLKTDFGEFIIHDSSIRYLSAPILPHSDIRGVDWLKENKSKGFKEGLTFLIPLWWKDGHTPGTAFYSCPANLNEPLYTDMPDILPAYSDQYTEEARNFSVRKIIKWESPGDLIAFESFQWHGSCQWGDVTYDRETWSKEFLSIETWREP
jgi:hypothetical protein